MGLCECSWLMTPVISLRCESVVDRTYKIFQMKKISSVNLENPEILSKAYFGAMSFNRRLRPFFARQ